MPAALRPLELRNIKDLPTYASDSYRERLEFLVSPSRAVPVTSKPILPRSSAKELAIYLSLSIKNPHVIRPSETFESAYPDGPMRVLALIEHLFVRYPVPLCLFRPMLSPEGLMMVFDEGVHGGLKKRMQREATYREWFHAISRGDSFAELTRDRFTRREAHWFLKTPTHLSIDDCAMWAQAAAAGVPPEACNFILDRYQRYVLSGLGDRLPEFFQFYARTWGDFDPAGHAEIADYIRHSFFEGSLSLKGRSASSVLKLCEAWHREFNAVWTEKHVSWLPAYETWTGKDGLHRVEVMELTGSVHLSEEGSRQSHCVTSYTDSCLGGYCRIVSVRWFADTDEIKRLTLEVRPEKAEIVQIRGRFNRRALPEELAVIRSWAGTCGLSVSSAA
jgi:hypothetical protein